MASWGPARQSCASQKTHLSPSLVPRRGCSPVGTRCLGPPLWLRSPRHLPACAVSVWENFPVPCPHVWERTARPRAPEQSLAQEATQVAHQHLTVLTLSLTKAARVRRDDGLFPALRTQNPNGGQTRAVTDTRLLDERMTHSLQGREGTKYSVREP